MWIDKVKEAKKTLNMSNKAISLATNGKLSERDVMRLIGGEYKKPYVDDVITLGAALKLTPQQLFGEENMVVESASAATEATALKARIETLERELAHKEELLAHKEEVIALKDELLRLYRERSERSQNVLTLSTL
jgi:hypothetical protein